MFLSVASEEYVGNTTRDACRPGALGKKERVNAKNDTGMTRIRMVHLPSETTTSFLFSRSGEHELESFSVPHTNYARSTDQNATSNSVESSRGQLVKFQSHIKSV